jgi:alpha-D-ribose 1-methylphosphonate 5-triphosphate diphosphatase PhnM
MTTIRQARLTRCGKSGRASRSSPPLWKQQSAPSLLAGVFHLIDSGLVDLPSAVRMVTANPARAVGLSDRGEIRPGARADLIAVRRDRNGLATVETVWFGGDVVYTFASRR